MKTPLKRSPYDLMQERLRRRPWALLVGCILYNRVRGSEALPVLQNFLADFPTPEALLEELDASRGRTTVELIRRFEPLGLMVRRAQSVVEMTEAWPDFDVKTDDVARLPGCGRYAAESFEIFCRGRLVPRPQDKELRRYTIWARVSAGRRGTD